MSVYSREEGQSLYLVSFVNIVLVRENKLRNQLLRHIQIFGQNFLCFNPDFSDIQNPYIKPYKVLLNVGWPKIYNF